MRLLPSLFVAAVFAQLFAVGNVLGTISNGDFSSGLTGWTTSGQVGTATSYSYPNPGGGTITPTSGTRVSELVTVGGSNLATLESTLGITSGSLQALSDGLTHPYSHYTLTNGSVITRTITGASDYLSFDWNFWRRDYPPYNDLAFFTISGPGISGGTDIILLADVNNSAEALDTTSWYGPAYGTGWNSYSYALPTMGDYTIGFGIVNARDTSYATYLHIDNVDSVVIPEPSAALTALALFGAGLLYPLRRRRA